MKLVQQTFEYATQYDKKGTIINRIFVRVYPVEGVGKVYDCRSTLGMTPSGDHDTQDRRFRGWKKCAKKMWEDFSNRQTGWVLNNE